MAALAVATVAPRQPKGVGVVERALPQRHEVAVWAVISLHHVVSTDHCPHGHFVLLRQSAPYDADTFRLPCGDGGDSKSGHWGRRLVRLEPLPPQGTGDRRRAC